MYMYRSMSLCMYIHVSFFVLCMFVYVYMCIMQMYRAVVKRIAHSVQGYTAAC